MSEFEDCECEAQTINHQSNVIMTRPAAETEVSNKNTYDRQRGYDESIICSVDGTICFPLEINPKILIEEAHHVNVFRCDFMKGLTQENYMRVLTQRKSEIEDGKCDI
jgi:hypothetical protein